MIANEIIHALRAKAEVNAPLHGEENSWGGYATLLEYLNEAAERAPTAEAITCTDVADIDRIFGEELEKLAELVLKLFPHGGVAEFATYVRST